MTETPSTYDVAPTRCHCDADWQMVREAGQWEIHCVACYEVIMDFEAVARWNEQRALVAEYDYRRELNPTDLATLQTELRAATQENMRLRLWATAWKAAAKGERAEATAFEAALTTAEERAETAERELAQATIEIDCWRVAEQQVSDAYLCVCQKLDAVDMPTAPTLEQIAQVTESKLDELLAEVKRLRSENTMLREAHTGMRHAWHEDMEQARLVKERAETAERELAIERAKCGRCGLFISHQPDNRNVGEPIWRIMTNDGEWCGWE